MSTTKYRALLLAHELGNLTRVAEKMGYTQPGVSHMISSLEGEVGFALLIRHKDGVEVTENARRLIPYFSQVVHGEEKLWESVQRINGIQSGTIRIGSYYSVSIHWIPPWIKEFQRRYPAVEFELFQGEDEELIRWLSEGKIDLSVVSQPSAAGFEFLSLMDDPLLAVVPNDHPLAEEKIILLSELLRHPFIRSDDDEELQSIPKERKPLVKYRVRGSEAILSMVSQGLGVSLVHGLVVKKPFDQVAARPIDIPVARTLGIALRSLKYAAPATREFIAMVQEDSFHPDNW